MAMPIKVFSVGDRVEMKKAHPCGSHIWKVLRTGADVRMECEGCQHQVMLARVKFEKGMKRILAPEIPTDVKATKPASRAEQKVTGRVIPDTPGPVVKLKNRA